MTPRVWYMALGFLLVGLLIGWAGMSQYQDYQFTVAYDASVAAERKSCIDKLGPPPDAEVDFKAALRWAQTASFC